MLSWRTMIDAEAIPKAWADLLDTIQELVPMKEPIGVEATSGLFETYALMDWVYDWRVAEILTIEEDLRCCQCLDRARFGRYGRSKK